jgi:hypothetical protein
MYAGGSVLSVMIHRGRLDDVDAPMLVHSINQNVLDLISTVCGEMAAFAQ